MVALYVCICGAKFHEVTSFADHAPDCEEYVEHVAAEERRPIDCGGVWPA